MGGPLLLAAGDPPSLLAFLRASFFLYSLGKEVFLRNSADRCGVRPSELLRVPPYFPPFLVLLLFGRFPILKNSLMEADVRSPPPFLFLYPRDCFMQVTLFYLRGYFRSSFPPPSCSPVLFFFFCFLTAVVFRGPAQELGPPVDCGDRTY